MPIEALNANVTHMEVEHIIWEGDARYNLMSRRVCDWGIRASSGDSADLDELVDILTPYTRVREGREEEDEAPDTHPAHFTRSA